MKIYNFNIGARIFFSSALLFLAFSPAYLAESDVRPLLWALLVLSYPIVFIRDLFCPFIIDEKGITNKLFGRWDIFIAWDEIEYIHVGERHFGGDYAFMMCFSTCPLEKIYFDNKLTPHNKQTRQALHVVYREGMLGEILKYMDESRIEGVERIKNCSNPHEEQDYEASMLKQIKDREKAERNDDEWI